MLIDILSERSHYWIAKVDLAAIDAQGRPIENPTVQIDVESRRGSISVTTHRRVRDPSPILHCSPTGLRRACDLRDAYEHRDPEVPRSRLGLRRPRCAGAGGGAARLFAEDIAGRLKAAGIRAMSMTGTSVNRKVREAG